MNSRQQIILTRILEKQKCSVAELANEVGVSVVTIRNDLNTLEKSNYIKRVHGFAVAVDSDDLDARMAANFPVKKSLAEFAASLVSDKETIFIEGGSTNAFLARVLSAQHKKLTIITLSAYIARILRDSSFEVILLGGIYQKSSESMVGPLARSALQQVHFNKAFFGIDGYHLQTGFTGRDMMRVDVVNTALQKCSENIILTDSSKFGQIHPNTIGPVNLINRVITDFNLTDKYKKSLTDSGISVDLVGQNS